MKKKCHNDSIFKKNYLKRYYTLDFGNAMMFIKDSETIPFRDITRVYLPQFGMDEVFATLAGTQRPYRDCEA